MVKVGDKMKNINEELKTSVFQANKNDKYLLYRHKSNSPSPGHDEYLFTSGNTLDELFDNWIEVMRRGGYGYSGSDLAKQKRIFNQNKEKYWSRPESSYTLKINKMKKLTTEQKSKVKKFIKNLKESKTLKENNTYTMLSALRDILDDLMLNTEMLIDNKYGKVDHDVFKKEWYRYTSQFENKFKNIQKNLISAEKNREK